MSNIFFRPEIREPQSADLGRGDVLENMHHAKFR
jgi:hypothetical protein